MLGVTRSRFRVEGRAFRDPSEPRDGGKALDREVGIRMRLVRALDLEVGARVRVEGRIEGRERDERFERLAEGLLRASAVVSARAETSGTNIRQTAKNSTKERLIVHLLVSGTGLPDGGSGIPFNKNIFERAKFFKLNFWPWMPCRKSW